MVFVTNIRILKIIPLLKDVDAGTMSFSSSLYTVNIYWETLEFSHFYMVCSCISFLKFLQKETISSYHKVANNCHQTKAAGIKIEIAG